MKKNLAQQSPAVNQLQVDIGGRIRLARLRRKISASEFAALIGVSRNTLNALETGNAAGMSFATVLSALEQLGMLTDMLNIGLNDEEGRQLQDETTSTTSLQKGVRKQRKKGSHNYMD